MTGTARDDAAASSEQEELISCLERVQGAAHAAERAEDPGGGAADSASTITWMSGWSWTSVTG